MGSPNSEEHRGSRGRVLLVARYLLTAAVLLLCFWAVGFREAAALMTRADPVYLLLAMLVVSPAIQLLKITKWTLFARRADPANNVARTARPFLLGVLAGIVTPGKVGEFARIAGLAGKRLELLVLFLLDKVVELYVVLVLIAATLVYLVLDSVLLYLLTVAILAIGFMAAWRFGGAVKSYVLGWIHRKAAAPESRSLSELSARFVAAQLAMSLGTYLLLLTQFALVAAGFGMFDTTLVLSGSPAITV